MLADFQFNSKFARAIQPGPESDKRGMPSKCACGCGELVAKARCFKAGCQPDGTSCDPEGKMKAANKIRNPVNNAKDRRAG